MRLLVDAYWWHNGPPSGRNVLQSMVSAWVEDFPEDDLTLALPAGGSTDIRSAGDTVLPVSVQHYPQVCRVHALAVASLRPSSDEFDAVLTQNFAAPLARAVCATLVHDALFVTNPEWFTRRERLYLSALRPSLRWADVVLTTSHAETARISRVWPEVAERCAPVGLGVPRAVTEADPIEPKTAELATRRFVLCVGRLNVRKNLARLIAAFGEITDKVPHHLVIVGEPEGAVGRLEVPERAREAVHFLGHVNDGELNWLYEHADLFVFPSLDEGFGLPLLEAAAAGTPSIASDIAVFRELDLAVTYFDPSSVESIRSALLATLTELPVSEACLTGWSASVSAVRAAIDARLR